MNILFDLDGTLADTALDMGAALNLLLKEEGQTPLAEAEMRAIAGQGGAHMVRCGFGQDMPKVQFQTLLNRFLALYQKNLCVKTCLFTNVVHTLQQLSKRQITWGIVTNKPERLAAPLLSELNIGTQAACYVYGDTVATKKPEPDSLLHAAKLIKDSPEQCVYLGDSERDMQAAVRAGMQNWFADYGYEELPTNDAWKPQRIINDVADVLKHLS